MIIKTQVHTIIMLVGPSGSGKTTFAKNILIPQLNTGFIESKNFVPNVQYISSDEIRRDILGYDYDKTDEIMTESSTQAFELLFTKLKAVTTYPINAEYVILDTTGLSEKFRNDVLSIADENNYNVDVIVFDYKKVDEYKKRLSTTVDGEISGRLIAKHMKRLKTETLKTLKKGTYKNIFKIKKKDFMIESYDSESASRITYPNPDYKVFAWDFDKYVDRILPKQYDWIIIGDVHGCYNEMKALIEKYGFKIEDDVIIDGENTEKFGFIFAGDLVDKSNIQDIEKTLRFIHKNMTNMGDRLQLVVGNHEEMVWKWITKQPDLEITDKRIEEKDRYYNTVALLEGNDELRKIFMDIFNAMKGWVKFIGRSRRSFIVTHAPCEIKFLEKMDGKSLKKQYKCLSRSENKELSNDQLTPYLKKEAVNNQPVHIFAHMDQTSVRTFKNKVCIDAGCVYGGKLIGYSIKNGKPFIQSVSKEGSADIKNDFSNPLFAEVAAERKEVDIASLSDSNQRRLRYLIDNGIGYIGGTISPAPKDEETGELESLKAGLDYYKDKVKTVVLQPKYMGSRAQVYLNKDIDKCYATSRNGYKIRIDLTEMFKAQLEEHKLLMEKFQIQELVMDGELMPWASLGKGLIDSHFRVLDEAIKSEITFLSNNGFDDALMELREKYQASGYIEDRNHMTKKDLAKKYGHDYNNFKNLQQELDRHMPIDAHKDAYNIYKEQIDIYGADCDIHFKPFRILKATKTEDHGGETFKFDMDAATQFSMINKDEICVIDFGDENYFEVAQKWYDKITQIDKMEGCVIKPNDKVVEGNVAPFMKVRNPKYLTIIYGYDMYFPKKFEKLFKQKNIGRKLKSSITEYKLGEQMLDAEMGSKEQEQIIANMLFENEKEMGIDPRL